MAPDNVTDKTVTWTSDKPTVATVDETGKVTAVAAGTATITAQAGDKTATCVVTVTAGETYLKWDGTQKKLVETAIPENATAVTNAEGAVTWSGTYVVEGNVTIGGKITLGGDVDLIIKDGAKLTVNNDIYGNSSKYNLSIYGQANQTGQLVVNSTDDAIRFITTLEVHSCQVKSTSSSHSSSGFKNINTFNVYGGSVDAEETGTVGYGIYLSSNGSMNIYGGEVKAVGKGTGSNSYGIYGNPASVTVYGGKLWAECAGQKALYSGITLTTGAGFTGSIQFSFDNENWADWVSGTPTSQYVKVE